MNTPSLTLCMQLYRAQAILARRFSFHGLGFSDFIILFHLGKSPEGRMRRVELAEQLGVTASAVTRTLLPMEKIGLVSREPDARDARVAYATITPAGRQLLSDALVTAERISQEVIPESEEGKLANLLGLLQRL